MFLNLTDRVASFFRKALVSKNKNRPRANRLPKRNVQSQSTRALHAIDASHLHGRCQQSPVWTMRLDSTIRYTRTDGFKFELNQRHHHHQLNKLSSPIKSSTRKSFAVWM